MKLISLLIGLAGAVIDAVRPTSEPTPATPEPKAKPEPTPEPAPITSAPDTVAAPIAASVEPPKPKVVTLVPVAPSKPTPITSERNGDLVRARARRPERIDPDFWKAWPLGLVPDGVIAKAAERTLNQVQYARTELGIAALEGAVWWPRADHWERWASQWGRERVRRWLIQHGSEETIEKFDAYVARIGANPEPAAPLAPGHIDLPDQLRYLARADARRKQLSVVPAPQPQRGRPRQKL